jgi:hypothetical protein
MDKLKGALNKITGKQDGYSHNLLGENLPDLLRKATAKTLVTPDEVINQQVRGWGRAPSRTAPASNDTSQRTMRRAAQSRLVPPVYTAAWGRCHH